MSRRPKSKELRSPTVTIPVPRDLTQEQARFVSWVLRGLIDTLIDFDSSLRRTYDIREVTVGDPIPF